jgi:succinate dehydrogenase hydrophobic anchor subunit
MNNNPEFKAKMDKYERANKRFFIFIITGSVITVVLLSVLLTYILHNPEAIGEWFGRIASGFSKTK